MMLLLKEILSGKERIYVSVLPAACRLDVRDRNGNLGFPECAGHSDSAIGRHS
jgi:hypothetical protein